MFSGMVKHIGIVKRFGDMTMSIQSSLRPKIGASIAVNGLCLTATKLEGDIFEVALSKESRDMMAIENMQGKVHLEEALSINDRLDGHIVQGHIDCIGQIESIQKNQNGFDFYIKFDISKAPLIVPKGSIAIDGISLTINSLENDIFRLTIIPHTFYETLFHTYKPKRRVHIETDIINRSIFHILQTMQKDCRESQKQQWHKIDSILSCY